MMAEFDRTKKIAYICCPLTELPKDIPWFLVPLVRIWDIVVRGWLFGDYTSNRWTQSGAKKLYSRLGDVCEQVLGTRAFVPHEHFDPIQHASATPQQVYAFESAQVKTRTSVLVVVALAPTWGGGMEVAWAANEDVPIVLLIPYGKRVSRLLRGSPAIVATENFRSDEEACVGLERMLLSLHPWLVSI